MFVILLILFVSVISSELNNMGSSNLHKVFVYGTLKRGEPNHAWFSNDKNGYYKFLYDAITTIKYPLIIGTKYNIPFILDSPGNGTYVKGELYEVDDTVFNKLDLFEDHPNFYIRDLYEVKPVDSKNTTTKAWIYVIKNFKKELLDQPFYEKYSNLENQERKYVESEEATLNDLNNIETQKTTPQG